MPDLSSMASGSVTTVWDNGPPDRSFDLVAVGDGFGADDQHAFAEHVRSLAHELLATPPFDLLRRLVSVHRIDLVSSGRSPFGTVLPDEGARLLTVDEGAVLAVARRHVPWADAVVLVVNTASYAGSGGAVACTTRHPRSAALAIHELGHSAFGLADEYGHQLGPHPGPRFLRANVTLERDPTKAPWADLVAPGSAVGCFEGADGCAGGVFRAEPVCRMRSLSAPFCVVCAREIRRTLLAHRSGTAGPVPTKMGGTL